MNCTQCNTEIPNGASFCPQCACPIAPPLFSTEPQHPQSNSAGTNFFTGFACIVGVILIGIAIVSPSIFQTMPEPLLPEESDAALDAVVESAPTAHRTLDLYGKTINDEDFDWQSLRGKYVLVKFTATWCGPCKREIPGMLEAYEKYHDKGLEIVSVYVWQKESDPVAAVKQFVEKEKLPWIILSESLTEKGKQPPQSKTYNIRGVPTMLLVDKEGMVLTANARGQTLKQELEKLFGE